MAYYKSPTVYEAQTGKHFTIQCPSIKKPPIWQQLLFKQTNKWLPTWADIVQYGTRLYWVNAYKE